MDLQGFREHRDVVLDMIRDAGIELLENFNKCEENYPLCKDISHHDLANDLAKNQIPIFTLNTKDWLVQRKIKKIE